MCHRFRQLCIYSVSGDFELAILPDLFYLAVFVN